MATAIDRDQLGILLDALPPIFRDCVEPDPSLEARYYLCYPQAIGDRVYATDGRIAVRCKATPDLLDLIPPVPRGGRFPYIAPLFDDSVGWEETAVPLPDLSALPRCRHCEGRGYFAVATVCPVCHGEDEDHCANCGESLHCRRCNDRGRIPAGTCVACFGSGIDEDDPDAVPVGKGVELGSNYLAVLHRHGAVLYLPKARLDGDRHVPVRFVAGDAEGLVMPMEPTAPGARVRGVVGEASLTVAPALAGTGEGG